jgi:hypothetical protein
MIYFVLLNFSFPDEIFTGTMQIAGIKPDFDKPNPKVGVSCIQFSSDNRYMFTRNGKFFVFTSNISIINLSWEVMIIVVVLRYNAEYSLDLEYGKIYTC